MLRSVRNPVAALTAAAVLALAAGACGSDSGGSSAAAAKDSFSAVYVMSDNLGDKGINDGFDAGMRKAATDLGVKEKVIEASPTDPGLWLQNMQSVSDGSWNLVITAFGQQKENLTQAAPQHPNQKYVYFDDEVKGDNIWNIKFRQNEGSYLAGVLAALATSDTKSFPLSKGNKRVAVLGGQDLPVIRDFIVGFQDGVKDVDPSIAVDVAFAGSFADPNKGYSVATALYEKGADVIFPVAGGTGIGTLKAARDAKRYSIGVDADQNGLYPGHVLASMVKRTDVAVYDAIKKAKDGSAPYGTLSYYGLKNHGVDLILDDDLVPASAKKRLDQATQDVVSGKVNVRSALN